MNTKDHPSPAEHEKAGHTDRNQREQTNQPQSGQIGKSNPDHGRAGSGEKDKPRSA